MGNANRPLRIRAYHKMDKASAFTVIRGVAVPVRSFFGEYRDLQHAADILGYYSPEFLRDIELEEIPAYDSEVRKS